MTTVQTKKLISKVSEQRPEVRRGAEGVDLRLRQPGHGGPLPQDPGPRRFHGLPARSPAPRHRGMTSQLFEYEPF